MSSSQPLRMYYYDFWEKELDVCEEGEKTTSMHMDF